MSFTVKITKIPLPNCQIVCLFISSKKTLIFFSLKFGSLFYRKQKPKTLFLLIQL